MATKTATQTTYTTTITRITETTVAAYVEHDDARYGVTLTAQSVTCSCPHAMYRGGVCKHAPMVVERLATAFDAALAGLFASPASERAYHEAAVDAARTAYSRTGAWVDMAVRRAEAAKSARKVAA